MTSRLASRAEATLAKQLRPWTSCRRVVTVQYIRVEIDPIGPANGPRYRINLHPREQLRIAQIGQDAIGQHLIEIEVPDDPVGERQAQRKAADDLGLHDSRQLVHGHRLAKPVNRKKIVVDLRAPPVLNQLRLPQRCHSRTSLAAVRGNVPASTAPSSIVTCASWPA